MHQSGALVERQCTNLVQWYASARAESRAAPDIAESRGRARPILGFTLLGFIVVDILSSGGTIAVWHAIKRPLHKRI